MMREPAVELHSLIQVVHLFYAHLFASGGLYLLSFIFLIISMQLFCNENDILLCNGL